MQFVQFLVDENTQRLERPRRRVNFARLRSHHPADDVGQRARSEYRVLLARGDDGARDGAGATLFAKDVDDIGQIDLGGFSNDVRDGRAFLTHAHVERAIEAKGKAAFGLVELHRGHADVHYDPVDRPDVLRRADFGEIGKAAFDQRQATVRAIDEIEPAGDSGAVAVDAYDPGSRRVEDRAAVAAGAEGCVDNYRAFARREHLDRLAAENGNMPGRSHSPPPATVRRDLASARRADAQTLIPRCNLLGCHGMSRVNVASPSAKTGSAVHQLVTAVSVKKPLQRVHSAKLRPAGVRRSVSGNLLVVRLRAHTSRKKMSAGVSRVARAGS